MDNHMGQQNQHGNANPTHSNTVDVDAEESVPTSFTSKRPLGQDSSKEKAKRTKSVDTSSDSEFMTRMGDLSLERLSVYKTVVTTEEKKLESMNKNERQKLLLEKKKLNLEKLRLERQKLNEDKEEEIMILSMDLSKCNPLLRKYYEAKQQEILSRVTGSTSSTQ
jgi:flagellar motility protein MotE (MotC chaperone)